MITVLTLRENNPIVKRINLKTTRKMYFDVYKSVSRFNSVAGDKTPKNQIPYLPSKYVRRDCK